MDQTVHLSAVFGKEKVFVEETDDRLMRAFAFALKSFERKLSRLHRRKVDKAKSGDRTFKVSNLIDIFKRK
jgi:ribosome-associated translation inhibitor RaiA